MEHIIDNIYVWESPALYLSHASNGFTLHTFNQDRMKDRDLLDIELLHTTVGP